MRITVKADSATPAEVYNLTRAFQRTRNRGYEVPAQITKEPTVTVVGSAMSWESPALQPEHAPALLVEFERLEAEDAALRMRHAERELEEMEARLGGYPLGVDFN